LVLHYKKSGVLETNRRKEKESSFGVTSVYDLGAKTQERSFERRRGDTSNCKIKM